MTLIEKVLSRAVKQPSGCWEWQGATRNGYGCLWHAGRVVSAHRAILGEPVGMVCHHCDNRKCVNPDHLYVGDAKSNAEDRDRRGRRLPPRGEAHGCAKLTSAQVAEIRRSSDTNVALARRFGVSGAAVSLARRGRTW